jgi:hypothetical protein
MIDDWCIPPPPGVWRYDAPAIGPRLDTPSMGGSMPDAFVPADVPDEDWCILAPAVGDAYLVPTDMLPGWMTCRTPWWPNPRDNAEPREHQPYAVP